MSATILQFIPKDSSGFERLDKELGILMNFNISNTTPAVLEKYFFSGLNIKYCRFYAKVFSSAISSFSDGIFLNIGDNTIRSRSVVVMVVVATLANNKSRHSLLLMNSNQEINIEIDNFTAKYDETIDKINNLIEGSLYDI